MRYTLQERNADRIKCTKHEKQIMQSSKGLKAWQSDESNSRKLKYMMCDKIATGKHGIKPIYGSDMFNHIKY